jgi:DHA1 family tetracycline resistance protein-like MFS transporter
MPITCLGGLMIPGLQGLMTHRVSPAEQGQLQGANQSMAGLASMIGPSIFGYSLAWAVSHPSLGLPGLPLLAAGLFNATCAVLAIVAARRANVAPPHAPVA